MKRVAFVTENRYKFEVAQKALENTGVFLVQKKIKVPEIQSIDVGKVAKFSAKYAAEKLGEPVALTDAGYYIEALKGFPGPFIKFINNWLTSEDLLKLMEGKENRKVVVKACLAYCEPDKESIIFKTEAFGSIAEKAAKTDKEGTTSINEIFIPEGYDKVESEIPKEEMVIFWARFEKYWLELAKYLKQKTYSSKKLRVDGQKPSSL